MYTDKKISFWTIIDRNKTLRQIWFGFLYIMASIFAFYFYRLNYDFYKDYNLMIGMIYIFMTYIVYITLRDI